MCFTSIRCKALEQCFKFHFVPARIFHFGPQFNAHNPLFGFGLNFGLFRAIPVYWASSNYSGL